MKRWLCLVCMLVSAQTAAGIGGGRPAIAQASAQRLPMVGVLAPNSPDSWASFDAAFRAGLAESGYVDGQNVTVVERYANGDQDRLPALASELAALKVDVLV